MKLIHETYANKVERAVAAGAREITEKKRFPTKATPEIRRALSVVRRQAVELMKQYPEVVALGVFGSYMKGYPITEGDMEEKSDIDCMIFFDYSGTSSHVTQDPGVRVNPARVSLMKSLEREKLPTSPDILNIEKNNLKKLLLEKNYGNLARLFFPTIGTAIKEYRRWFLEELKASPNGEEEWAQISRHLAEFESHSFPEETKQKREKIYTTNIAQAVERYC